MNRSEIENMALREFGEGTSVAHFSGGATVVHLWLNDIKREFELETRLCYGTVGTTVTASARVAIIGTSLFHPVKVRHKGNYIDKTTMEDEGSNIFTKGTPGAWYVAENFNRIGLCPIPTGGQGGTVIVEGYKTTATLSNATSVPSFSPQYHRALVDGLLRRFYEEDSDSTRGDKGWARANMRYQKYVNLASRENWPSRARIVPHEDWR